MKKGLFLSDLHLLSGRSNIERHQDQISSWVEASDIAVLGGDIFDFKWSRQPTLDKAIEVALNWLTRLIQQHPRTSFYYLLGNHDCHPRFVAELDRLTFHAPNLQWQPYWLRLGQFAFLHGDILDGGLEHAHLDVKRKKHICDPIPQAYRHWLYDVAVQAKVHRVVSSLVNRQNWVLTKLYNYLSSQGLDPKSGVTDVYFGHTHRVINNVTYRGVHFHNGGACIKGLDFKILPFEFPSIQQH